MQTNLAAFIKDTPEGRDADAILRKCVHCGFCTATCPTYQLLGDELDGPRGRIYLIKRVLEGAEPTAKTQLHLDRCLTCRACETTCPSGVHYSRLLDIGRHEVDKRIGRGPIALLQRRALRFVLTRPALFKSLLFMGRLARPVLPTSLSRKIPAGTAANFWPKASHARKMLVLDGCVQPGLAPNTNAAAARVLDRLGITLVRAPQAGCCGAVSFHLSAQEEAREYMRRNIDAWWPYLEQGAEAVVITASGCGVMVKDYGYQLARDPAYAAKAQRVSELTRDISEVIAAEQDQAEVPHPSAPIPHSSPASSLPPALHPPARLETQRPGGIPARRLGLLADARPGFSLVLRIGRHLLDPPARTVAAAACQQDRRAHERVTNRNPYREHRLPGAPARRDGSVCPALD